MSRRAARRAPARLLWFIACGLGACAAPSAQLTADAIQRLEREARVEIYDRENDRSIARARADECVARGDAVRRQLAELEATAKRARSRLEKAGAADRVDRLGRALDARRAHLRAQIKLADAAGEVAVAAIEVARARLEQTRQRQLVHTGRALQTSLAPFDRRIEAGEQRQTALQKREQDARIDAEKSFDTWKSAEDEYARATGDYDSSIWID